MFCIRNNRWIIWNKQINYSKFMRCLRFRTICEGSSMHFCSGVKFSNSSDLIKIARSKFRLAIFQGWPLTDLNCLADLANYSCYDLSYQSEFFYDHFHSHRSNFRMWPCDKNIMTFDMFVLLSYELSIVWIRCNWHFVAFYPNILVPYTIRV